MRCICLSPTSWDAYHMSPVKWSTLRYPSISGERDSKWNSQQWTDVLEKRASTADMSLAVSDLFGLKPLKPLKPPGSRWKRMTQLGGITKTPSPLAKNGEMFRVETLMSGCPKTLSLENHHGHGYHQKTSWQKDMTTHWIMIRFYLCTQEDTRCYSHTKTYVASKICQISGVASGWLVHQLGCKGAEIDDRIFGSLWEWANSQFQWIGKLIVLPIKIAIYREQISNSSTDLYKHRS